MKGLAYFERLARKLKEENFDYRLMKDADLVLQLMQDYRKENDIPWDDYKFIYDKWFRKYH